MNDLEPPVQLGRPHSPSQAWTQRLPSPPRINVPPPLLDTRGLPDLGIAEGSIDFEANGFTNAAFLRQVTHGNIIFHNNMIEWQYEQRHQAQQILPFLYLGPVAAARDVDFLQRSGITMVVAVRNTLVRVSSGPSLNSADRQNASTIPDVVDFEDSFKHGGTDFVIVASQLTLAYWDQNQPVRDFQGAFFSDQVSCNTAQQSKRRRRVFHTNVKLA